MFSGFGQAAYGAAGSFMQNNMLTVRAYSVILYYIFTSCSTVRWVVKVTYVVCAPVFEDARAA